MSIQVPPEDLAEALRRFGGAYLVTVAGDRRAHIVAVAPVLVGARLHLGRPGRTTRRNVEDNPSVSLVWPPLEPGGHSLITDGVGSLDDDVLVVDPTRAVLHRPAPGGKTSGGGCAADCAEVSP